MVRWFRWVVIPIVVLNASLRLASQVPGEGWVRIGLLQGDVTAIGVSPGYDADQTVFVGLAGSGLWRSTDRGQNWTHLSSIPNAATVTAIAFDPRHSGSNGYPIYAGTLDGTAYGSFDNFATVGSLYINQFSAPVTAMAVPPAGSWQYQLFVATQGSGIFKKAYSSNFTSFQLTTAPGQNDVRALAAGPTGQVLAGIVMLDFAPVHDYTGSAWTAKGPAGMVNKVVTGLHIASSNPAHAFATIQLHGLWVSTNSASSWSAGCDGTPSVTATNLPTAVAACPNYSVDSEVWEGRFTSLYTSTNSGAACAVSTPTGYVTAIAFAPSYHMGTSGYCDAFVGTTAGLYVKYCGPAPAPHPITPPAVTVNSLAIAQEALPGTWAASPSGLLRNSSWDHATERPYFLQYNASGAGFGNTPDIVAVRLAPRYKQGGSCGSDEACLVVAEYNQGVFRSTDYGNSWTKLDYKTDNVSTWPSGAKVNDLAMSPQYVTGGSDETLFAATNQGLYRWDGSATGWTKVALDWSYNFTKVHLPPTYVKTTRPIVFVATDNASYPGLWFSLNNGVGLARFTHMTSSDITAIAASPDYGGADTLLFVARATSGCYFTSDSGASAYFCPFDAGLSSLNIRDLAVRPDPNYSSSATLGLLAATSVGPYYCSSFSKENRSNSVCSPSPSGSWAASTITPPSGCADTRAVAFAQFGDGNLAGVGTAEDGVFFSYNSGVTFPQSRSGIGYRSLPDDVQATFPYMRQDVFDPAAPSQVLLSTSPTFGVFISRNGGGSYQPYNGIGCTPLNDGALGVSGGFERFGADPFYGGWVDDALFVSSKCGGIYARAVLARNGSSVYYPYYLDWYWWAPTNSTGQPLGPFQQISTVTNGNIAEPILASSATAGCLGLGQYICPAGTATAFSAANSGLSSTNATSVRFGATTAPAPAALALGTGSMGSVAQGAWTYYTVLVPNGMSHLNVALHKLSQDADLYVRYAGLPTSTSYDYASTYGSTNPDLVNVDASSTPVPLTPGIWYIGVTGWAAGTTAFTLTASDALPLTSTVGSSGTVGYHKTNNYYIVVPLSGYPHLGITLTGLSNDADLYAKWASLASNTSYDSSSTNGSTTSETIDIRASTSPPLAAGVEYVGVYGYANANITYTVTATLYTSAMGFEGDTHPQDPEEKAPAPREESGPGPMAPSTSASWGTVSADGVYKGTGSSSAVAGPQAMTWAKRNGGTNGNGLGWGALTLTKTTQTVLQMTDGTLLAGQGGALWRSPDEGLTTWVDLSDHLPGASLNVKDFLETCSGDLLVGVDGSAGTGGVWLSGSRGLYWMNISSGFDSSSQKLTSLVKGSCTTPPVQYYGSTGETGVYTRTLTAQPYPAVTSISTSTGLATGSTTVEVYGTGFSNSCPTGVPGDCPFASAKVMFGDTPAVVTTFISSTHIQAVTPEHGMGPSPVSVINPDTRQGTCACTFTFTGDNGLTLFVTRNGGLNELDWGLTTSLTIQRATDPRFLTGLTQMPFTGSSWIDNSNAGTNGTTYYYRVQ